MAEEAVLLVEGKDDDAVVKAIAKNTAIDSTFIIKNGEQGGLTGGIEWVLQTLPMTLVQSDLKRLGVIVDADINLMSRWMSLTRILAREGYDDIPSHPDAGGTVVQPTGPRRPVVGIWLMPDNRLSGMLEDFTALLVPPGDPLFGYARDCVRGLPPEHVRFPQSHLPKADIHTWLAWQEEPGKPLGTAITARFLDASLPPAQAFRRWLVRLFG